MKRLKTFKGLKKGDWLFWDEEGGDGFISIVKKVSFNNKNYFLLEVENEWFFDFKDGIEKQDSQRSEWRDSFSKNFSKLNKEEIEKFKMKIALSEL